MSDTDKLLKRVPPQKDLLLPTLRALGEGDGKEIKTEEIHEIVRRNLNLPEDVMTLINPRPEA